MSANIRLQEIYFLLVRWLLEMSYIWTVLTWTFKSQRWSSFPTNQSYEIVKYILPHAMIKEPIVQFDLGKLLSLLYPHVYILFLEESLDMIFITYKLLRNKVPMMVQMIKQIGQNINISSLVKRYARVICIIFAIFLNSNFFSNKKQSSTQADTCTLTFTVILFTLAKRQEKSKHLETDE